MSNDNSAGFFGVTAMIIGWGNLAMQKLGIHLGSATTREVTDWVNMLTAIGAMAGTWVAVVIAVRKLKAKKDQ